MRLATWNLNSVATRLPRLVEWVEAVRPDVLCVQETKVAMELFPAEPFEALGYEMAHHGQGRWNGVGILSRIGLTDITRGFAADPGFPDPSTIEARAIGASCGPLRIWSAYVPNGRSPDDPHYDYKLRWLEAFTNTVAVEMKTQLTGGDDAKALAVVGDFNIAPTDLDVWDPERFTEATHVTPRERAAFVALQNVGLHDIFPRALKGDHPFTYWDYRAGAFHKGWGMRIDFVLASEVLRRAVTDAYVDRDARKGKGPSDHAPIVVEAEL